MVPVDAVPGPAAAHAATNGRRRKGFFFFFFFLRFQDVLFSDCDYEIREKNGNRKIFI